MRVPTPDHRGHPTGGLHLYFLPRPGGRSSATPPGPWAGGSGGGHRPRGSEPGGLGGEHDHDPEAEAEATHRDHAIVEQVIVDLKNSALAHLPSGHFGANSAWLVCAAIAHNLTRAAGALAGALHARARTATLRSRLINVAARIARSAGRLVLHLPLAWTWQPGLDPLFRRALHDPLAPAA
ncbi:MAG: hypothetical protein QOJ30_341 [Pseudonocardiales bacterium]|nr:hypothetical protein [Pseudonocardiales bacterium]